MLLFCFGFLGCVCGCVLVMMFVVWVIGGFGVVGLYASCLNSLVVLRGCWVVLFCICFDGCCSGLVLGCCLWWVGFGCCVNWLGICLGDRCWFFVVVVGLIVTMFSMYGYYYCCFFGCFGFVCLFWLFELVVVVFGVWIYVMFVLIDFSFVVWVGFGCFGFWWGVWVLVGGCGLGFGRFGLVGDFGFSLGCCVI